MFFDRANNCDYKPILTGFFFKYFNKAFCKGPWLVYNNIALMKNCSDHKVS